MPKQAAAASEYTSLVRSAAVANDMASKPTGSAGAAKSARSSAAANRGSLSLGLLSSIITQSTVGKIPRSIATLAVPLPISEKGLVLWIDASQTSSMVFGDNRTLGTSSYRTITSIKDSYKGAIGSRKAVNFHDPVYVPSVNSTFLTDSSIGARSSALNKPAIYFRGRNRPQIDSHIWTINQTGKPVTMFMALQGVSNSVCISSADVDSALLGYSEYYDNLFYTGYDNESWNNGSLRYDSYNKPVISTLLNRTSGSTKQVAMRVNSNERFSRNFVAGRDWFHNPNNLRTGRNNGEMAELLVYEIIVYNEIMTPSEITKVETYLKNKWNP